MLHKKSLFDVSRKKTENIFIKSKANEKRQKLSSLEIDHPT